MHSSITITQDMGVEKRNIAKQFSEKLTRMMSEKGYASHRSRGGIDINTLASIAGCSYQMARKYAIGQVLPDLPTIIKIANHLNCHPANLLFDELLPQHKQAESRTHDLITIDRSLLKYILNKSSALLSLSHDSEDIINFIVEIVYDAAHLDVDTKALHKIIDMMISSATLLNKIERDGTPCTK